MEHILAENVALHAQVQALQAQLEFQKRLCDDLQRTILEESIFQNCGKNKKRLNSKTPLQEYLRHHCDDPKIDEHIKTMMKGQFDPTEPVPKLLKRAYLIHKFKRDHSCSNDPDSLPLPTTTRSKPSPQ